MIQQLTYMSGFEIDNSTVVGWGEDAELNAKNHTPMRSITLVRTSLPHGELPRGLLSPSFPPLLRRFVSSTTNIHTLPSNLDKLWPRRMEIVVEFAPMTTFPDVVVLAQPVMILLAGCPITSVPAAVFKIPWLGVVHLSFSGLQELPAVVLNPSRTWNGLFLAHTNVSRFYS